MPLLIPSLIGLMVGAALLNRGLRGRRIGDEPHCVCGYLLHGLESKVCPECGEDVTPRTIRYGTRHRIRWQIITASCCLALGITGLSLHLTGVAQRIDWYRVLPNGWLASAAESGNRNALAELDRRLTAPKVNPRDFAAVVETGLRIQKDRPPAADLQAWLNLLSRLEASNCLSPQQRDQFFSRIVEFSLVARPRVRQGDPLAYRIEMVIYAPNTGAFTRRVNFNGARLGKTVVSAGGGYTESTNYSGLPLGDRQSSGTSADTTHVAPGPAELSVSILFGLHAVGTSASGGMPLWSKEITLTAPVDVFPPGTPDLIERRSDDVLANAWRKALAIDRVSYEPDVGSAQPLASVVIRATPSIPASAAFDVWLETDGKRERCTTISFHAPLSTILGSGVSGTTSLPLSERPVRVILLGSREAALGQPDIEGYLDNEIDLGEFKLTRDPTRPTPVWEYDASRPR